MSANPISDLTVPTFNTSGLTAAVELVRNTLAAAPSTQSQVTYGAGQSLGEVISALARIGA